MISREPMESRISTGSPAHAATVEHSPLGLAEGEATGHRALPAMVGATKAIATTGDESIPGSALSCENAPIAELKREFGEFPQLANSLAEQICLLGELQQLLHSLEQRLEGGAR